MIATPDIPSGLHPWLPPVIQVIQWIARPIQVLTECARRHGDVFALEFPGGRRVVFFSRPEHVRQLFTADTAELRAGEGNEILRPLLGDSSVVLLDGEAHIEMRRLLLPRFHGDSMMKIMEDALASVREATLRWPRLTPFSLYASLKSITLEIMIGALFGCADDSARRELKGLIGAFMRRVAPPALFLMAFTRLPPLPWLGMLRARRRVARAVYRIIRQRRAETDSTDRHDVLSDLLRAKDGEGRSLDEDTIYSQLITLLIASHETTATTLAWAFEELLHSPPALRRAVQEIDAVFPDGLVLPERLLCLHYLDGVLRETLRLHPVLPLVARKAAVDLTIGGYTLPAGTYLCACSYLTQRRPELYPEPEAFRPERWQDMRADGYCFYPYGGSRRRCLGMSFSLHEMKLILAVVLRHMSVDPMPGRRSVMVRRGITLSPSNGVMVTVTQRCAM